MNNNPFLRYVDILKNGIEPSLYPNEQFYYYTLPDFDARKKPSITLGKEIDSNKFLIVNKSLLISKLNPRIRRVWIVDNDERLRSVCSTEFINIVPKNDSLLEFLYYFLQNDDVYSSFEAEAVGTTNSHVRYKPDLLKKIKIVLPVRPIQRKIAKILTTVDNILEKTEALITKYSAIKQGMMQDLFTRGVDENGELRPSFEEAPELYKRTRLGWIPIDWNAERLSGFADLQVGYAFKSKWFTDTEGIKLLRGENVGHGKPDWSDTRLLPKNKASDFSQYILYPGDVIIGMDRTFTKSGVKISILSSSDCPSLLVQRVGKFVPRNCDKNYLKTLLFYNFYHYELIRKQKGMDIPHLSQNEILEPFLPLPLIGEQKKIAQKLLSIQNYLQVEISYFHKLKKIKSGLMQDLLTGKKRVKVDEDIEERPPDVRISAC
jgi:type I restriction enzyme, S subunit